MLNFKMGRFYKDTKGYEWVYLGCILRVKDGLNYYFRHRSSSVSHTFYEQEDNSVTFCKDGDGAKIHFVEEKEKEREWKIGGEYECYNTEKQKFSKVELLELDESRKATQYCFRIEGIERSFGYQKGEILCLGSSYVIFKNGIPEELRKRIEKGKLTNKRKCFQKGKIYKTRNGDNWKFIKRAKVKSGLVAMFECESNSYLDIKALLSIKGVECIKAGDKVNLCADESIRNEDGSKAVRIKE